MRELEILRDAAHEAREDGRIGEYRIILYGILELYRLSSVAEMPTEKQPAVCAWCLAEQNGAMQPKTSYGCCERHATAMREKRGLARVA